MTTVFALPPDPARPSPMLYLFSLCVLTSSPLSLSILFPIFFERFQFSLLLNTADYFRFCLRESLSAFALWSSFPLETWQYKSRRYDH
jgi:hypothetical protein